MHLHILPDEKIINRTISLFEEVFPNKNRYLILSSRHDKLLRNYVSLSCSQIYYVQYDTCEFWNIVGNVYEYNSIIVHYLTKDSASFINSISHPNISWIEWGGDLYNTFLSRKGYKLYHDEKLVAKMKYPFLPYFLYNILREKIYAKTFKNIYKSVFKIKNFIPDSMFDEYPLFLKYYEEFSHLNYKDFFYYPIDIILGNDLINEKVKGQSIIVGNSCSFTNNHKYILDILRDNNIKNEIILPLSYAGNQKYCDYLKSIGKKYFSDNFFAITEYLPLSEYNKILLGANSFIYGNLRQEAVGNILVALYIGGKVFLDENNPLFNFYKSIGLKLFGLKDISEENLNAKLANSYITSNRNILNKYYSSARLKSLIRENFPV